MRTTIRLIVALSLMCVCGVVHAQYEIKEAHLEEYCDILRLDDESRAMAAEMYKAYVIAYMQLREDNAARERAVDNTIAYEDSRVAVDNMQRMRDQNLRFVDDLQLLADTDDFTKRLQMAYRRQQEIRKASAMMTSPGYVDLILLAKSVGQPLRETIEPLIQQWEMELDAVMVPFERENFNVGPALLKALDVDSPEYRQVRYDREIYRAKISPIHLRIFAYLDTHADEHDRVRIRRTFIERGANLPSSIIETVCEETLAHDGIDAELRDLCMKLREEYRAAETPIFVGYIERDERVKALHSQHIWTAEIAPDVYDQMAGEIEDQQQAVLVQLKDCAPAPPKSSSDCWEHTVSK